MRSGPITSVGQPNAPDAIGALLTGAKQVGVVPAGRGPDATYSLSVDGVRSVPSSLKYWTTPSFGVRGSPLPPHTAPASVAGSVVLNATHGLLHVKPPFVERATKTPFVRSVRSKWMSA